MTQGGSIGEFIKDYKENQKQIKKGLGLRERIDYILGKHVSKEPVLFQGPASICLSKEHFLCCFEGKNKPHVKVSVYGKRKFTFLLVQLPDNYRYAWHRDKTLAEMVRQASEAESVYAQVLMIPRTARLSTWEKDISKYFGTISIDGQVYEFKFDNARPFSSTWVRKT